MPRYVTVCLRTFIFNLTKVSWQSELGSVRPAIRQGATGRARTFDRIGVFTYCREEGTPSHDMADQVPAEVALERKAELLETQQAVHLARNEARVGSEVEVLVEKFDAARGVVHGRTPQDAPEVDGSILVKGVGQARPGAFVRARVSAADGYDLVAEALGPVGA